MKRILIILAATLLLGACGQKGPLEMPVAEPEVVEVSQ
ncbi:LPS translocon maturation chaperone LptM [Salinibius halmophilus]